MNYLALAVSIIGLVIYSLPHPNNPKAEEIGKIMLWTGLLAFLITTSIHLPFIGH